MRHSVHASLSFNQLTASIVGFIIYLYVNLCYQQQHHSKSLFFLFTSNIFLFSDYYFTVPIEIHTFPWPCIKFQSYIRLCRLCNPQLSGRLPQRKMLLKTHKIHLRSWLNFGISCQNNLHNTGIACHHEQTKLYAFQSPSAIEGNWLCMLIHITYLLLPHNSGVFIIKSIPIYEAIFCMFRL